LLAVLATPPCDRFLLPGTQPVQVEAPRAANDEPCCLDNGAGPVWLAPSDERCGQQLQAERSTRTLVRLPTVTVVADKPALHPDCLGESRQRSFIVADFDQTDAPPMAALVSAMNAMADATMSPATDKSILRILRGDHNFRFHRTIKPGDLLAVGAKTVNIDDKISGVATARPLQTRSSRGDVLNERVCIASLRGVLGGAVGVGGLERVWPERIRRDRAVYALALTATPVLNVNSNGSDDAGALVLVTQTLHGVVAGCALALRFHSKPPGSQNTSNNDLAQVVRDRCQVMAERRHLAFPLARWVPGAASTEGNEKNNSAAGHFVEPAPLSGEVTGR
jgi:hypothetical protein